MDQEDCDLGNIEFQWREGHPLLPLVHAHGAMVVDGAYNAENVIGCVDSETSSLIWGAGGSAIAEGDTVVHNADYCEEGRKNGANEEPGAA